MMVQANLVNAILLASVPVADAFGLLTPTQLLLVALGVGTGFVWFDSAAWGALPTLVGRGHLPRANSVILGASVVTGLVAPALTGLAITAMPPSLVLGVDALSYVVSAILISRIRTSLDGATRSPATSVRNEITVGLKFIWRQPIIRTLTITGFLLSAAPVRGSTAVSPGPPSTGAR